MKCVLKRGRLDSYRIRFQGLHHGQTMESALMLAVVGKHILAPKLGCFSNARAPVHLRRGASAQPICPHSIPLAHNQYDCCSEQPINDSECGMYRLTLESMRCLPSP